MVIPSPLQELADERLGGVRLLLKRDDLIHPQLPGNKWRKLRHNLAAARGQATLLTFGGAYSNHILATAYAGREHGFATVGVIRGEPHAELNPVLAAATAYGMTLTYLDRSSYRAPDIAKLTEEFGDFYLIPEGGANALGVRGCAELVAELATPFDVICCAAGTGTTLAGVATALGPHQHAIGFPVVKGGGYLAAEVRRLQGTPTTNFSLRTDFHFGGFARIPPALTAFTADFQARHTISLNPVYEAKMMAGLFTIIAGFPPGTTVVALLA
jgi:1-aminocyclopropane-1-carboxylate deaminase